MKKMLLIIAAFLLIPCIASAVIFRENKQGQMLVTKLNITQYDRQGNLNPNFRSEYEFTYDDDTDDLVKVVWTRWIKGTVHKEVLQREGDGLRFSYYIDNKLQSKHKREYVFNARNNLIRLCKITEEHDSRIGKDKEITILQYTNFFNSGMKRKMMKLQAHNTVYNYIRDIKYGEQDDLYGETRGVLSLNFGYDHDINTLGFRNAVNYLIADDNLMYSVQWYKEEPFFTLNGNIVTLQTLDLGKLSTNKYAVCQEYTDIENPTNINMLPLAYQNYYYGQSMDQFIETVTPWYIFKSKYLPLRDQKTFSYEINNKGQLEQVRISSFDGMPYSTVVEFEYECDFSEWVPVEH